MCFLLHESCQVSDWTHWFCGDLLIILYPPWNNRNNLDNGETPIYTPIYNILFKKNLCLYFSAFDKTNIVWTLFNGRKEIAAYVPGDPFRGPRRYGKIPWEYNAKIPYGISYHYARNTLVFSDLSRQSIYFIDTASGFWNVTKFHAGFGWVEHTAMDWVSDNLYWVDGYYEWVAMKSLDSTDVHEYKIIADVNVVSPRGIVVDPNMG